MAAHYFLGSRLLGTTPAYQTWDGALPLANTAHCCSGCGEVWGRVVVEGRGDWQFVTSACPKCRQWGERLPGSFLFIWNHNHANELPVEVVRREVHLIIDHLIKQGILT